MGLMKKPAAAPEQSREDFTELTAESLGHPDPDIRRRAAQTLRGDAVVPALLDALETEQKRPVRAAIFNALRDIGSEQVAIAMAPLLGSENTEIRNGAVAVMKTLGTKASDIMPDLLAHEDPDIRIMAIDILQDLGHPSAPEWLGEVLERDRHQNVLGAAIDRMVEIGTADQCNALRRVAERFSDDPFIAFATAEAIRAIEAGADT